MAESDGPSRPDNGTETGVIEAEVIEAEVTETKTVEPPRGQAVVGEGDPQLETSDQDLPPVVSRLVVEIRSDGRKTMARGAIEDVQTGQRVAISADARSLVELSGMLVQSLGQTVGSVLPRLGRDADTPRPAKRLRSAAKTARRLLGRRRRRH